MPLYFLYFNFLGFLLSGIFLFLFGHRIKQGRRLFSLLYLGLIASACHLLLQPWISSPVRPLFPVFFLLAIGSVVIALTEEWNAFGQVSFVTTLTTAAALLIYTGSVPATFHLDLLNLTFSVLMFSLQTFAMFFVVAHMFEVVDVVCRIRWRRLFSPRPAKRFPKVSLHISAYNEPPSVVIQTLNALAGLDYPDYEVIVINNNTTDERRWRPVEAHCRRLGFRFFHLDN